jgi:hypothetical protein
MDDIGERLGLVEESWKTLIIAAMTLLAVAGMFVVLFNLPVVTGVVPN